MHEVDMTKCLLLSLQEWKREHEPHTPCVSAVHLEVGDFTLRRTRRPALHLRRCRAGHLAGWLETPDRHRAPARPAAWAAPPFMPPRPDQAYRSPCCDRPMEEIISGRELRICSVDYSLSPLSASPQSSGSTSLSSR